MRVLVAGLMVIACVLFPALSDTFPPFRWHGDVIATSAAQHLMYAASATATFSALARCGPGRGSKTGAAWHPPPPEAWDSSYYADWSSS